MSFIKVSPAVSARNQSSSKNCWLTCLQMMFEWKGKNSDADSILAKMDTSPDLYPYYMQDNGIAPYECKDTAKTLGLTWGEGEIDAETAAKLLKKRGPLWVAGQWYMGYDHVVLLTSIEVDSGRIKIIDPWKNYNLSDTPKTISWLNERGNVWKNCNGAVMYW